MQFTKPNLGNVKAKILLLGSAGAGKTYGALTFPKPAVIDSEGSVDLYAADFDFVSVPTKSLSEAIDLTDAVINGKVKIDGKPCETLVIDSLTSFYNTVQHAGMADDGSIGMQQWGLIKRKFGEFVDMLYHKADCHVICTSWVKPKFTGNDKKSGELLSDGEVIDGDRKVSYAFDLIFKLNFDEKTGKRTATVLKARGVFGKHFNAGDVIPGGFNYELIRPILEGLKSRGKRDTGGTESDAVKTDKQLFQADTAQDHTAQLADAIASFDKAFPGTATGDRTRGIIDAIVGHFDLQTRPGKWADVTAQQLKWAAGYYAKFQLEEQHAK
jgi:hypothetical protein